MGNTKVITIAINKKTLLKVTEYIEDLGAGSTRSGFINDAIEYYLKIRRGLKPYKRIFEDEKV